MRANQRVPSWMCFFIGCLDVYSSNVFVSYLLHSRRVNDKLRRASHFRSSFVFPSLSL